MTWSKSPFDKRAGHVRVMRHRCSTCIFRPGNKMSLEPGRVKAMVDDIKKRDSFIPCHVLLGTGLPGAICRGGDDAHHCSALQVAERLGFVRVVTEAEVLAEIAAREARRR